MTNYLEMFKRCQEANYIRTDNFGDYAITIEASTIYLLFEWSNGSEDWRNNFDFPAVPYKRMESKWRCHRGFLRVWKSMRDEIDKQIAEILSQHPEIDTIICVGYSHGGALCLLATEEMEYLHGNKCTVSGYGFGAPRVIWGIVPKDVKKRLANYHLVRNSGDIVTHVPPLLFGFRTIGKKDIIGKFCRYSPIKAHYASAYIAEMQKIIDNAANM